MFHRGKGRFFHGDDQRDWRLRGEFFQFLQQRLRTTLPDELRGFTFRHRGSLAQVHYGDPSIHFEAWFHWKTNLLELGLHVERDERTNDRLFRAFDRHILEIKAELGDSVDLERWDRGWCRIYEMHRVNRLDSSTFPEFGNRFSRIVEVLAPLTSELTATELQQAGASAKRR